MPRIERIFRDIAVEELLNGAKFVGTRPLALVFWRVVAVLLLGNLKSKLLKLGNFLLEVSDFFVGSGLR